MPVLYAASGNCHVYVDASTPTSTRRWRSRSTRRCSGRACATRSRRCSCTATSRRSSCRARSAELRERGVELRVDGRAKALAGPLGRLAARRDRGGLGDRVPRADPGREAWSTPPTRRSSTSTATAAGTPRRSSPASTEVGAARSPIDVDAACVYVNASTRFTDGAQFGMGAEIGNSTQKLHARGPIGLRELCTFKYVVEGDGQVRP